MLVSKVKMLFLMVVLAGLVFAVKGFADESDQKTILTFSAPVEIPMRVLPAGTYVFKVLDVTGDRNIVQVLNKDETQAYATVMTVDDYTDQPSDKPYIGFAERPSGSPMALRVWFYPGRDIGHEFVYPRIRAGELAKVNNRSVLAMPNEQATNMTKPAKSKNDASITAMEKSRLMRVTPQNTEDSAKPVNSASDTTKP